MCPLKIDLICYVKISVEDDANDTPRGLDLAQKQITESSRHT